MARNRTTGAVFAPASLPMPAMLEFDPVLAPRISAGGKADLLKGAAPQDGGNERDRLQGVRYCDWAEQRARSGIVTSRAASKT